MINVRNLYYTDMSRFIFLLGREPDISLAELKSLFSDVKRVGDFAFLETEEDIIPLVA